jgi:hypothetical protein
MGNLQLAMGNGQLAKEATRLPALTLSKNGFIFPNY